jgi:hypothetical protein
MLIAGDIGGTKTDLAICSTKSGPHAPLAERQVHSADYPSLQVMVSEVLAELKMPVDVASFDVAGPVINGRAKVTNLPWVMDGDSLASDLRLRAVHLINDLEAVARAVPVLRASDLITINEGDAVANGPIGIVAPGTGLGESFLTWNGSQYVPMAPRAATRISRPLRKGKSGYSDSCCRVGVTLEWNEFAPGSAFRTFTSFCGMKKKSQNGTKLRSGLRHLKSVRMQSWKPRSVRKIQANCVGRPSK